MGFEMISSMIPVRPQASHLRDILRADFGKNGSAMAGRVSVDDYIAGFEAYVSKGGLIFLAGKMFVAYKSAPDEVEFHCVNGGSGTDLTNGLNQFLAWASTLFVRAVTYYDNPKNSELLARYIDFPSVVEQADDGLYRTFRATIKIRESAWVS
jgi:hypothetical protein